MMSKRLFWLLSNKWKILSGLIVIMILIVAFFMLMPKESISGFGDVTILEKSYSLNTKGEAVFRLKNNSTADLMIWIVGVVDKKNGKSNYTEINYPLDASSDSLAFTVSGLGTYNAGDYYSININIIYGTLSNNLTSMGTISGRTIP